MQSTKPFLAAVILAPAADWVYGASVWLQKVVVQLQSCTCTAPMQSTTALEDHEPTLIRRTGAAVRCNGIPRPTPPRLAPPRSGRHVCAELEEEYKAHKRALREEHLAQVC
jgi:hypothetical protein